MASGGRPSADALYHLATLRVGDIDGRLCAAWDTMPERRAEQADIYDSFAWLSSWLSAAPDGTADRLVIPAVFAGDQPMALLPVLRSGRGRAVVAGADVRTRARPVLAEPAPSAGLLAALAESVAGCGIRELALHRLPSRDPATAAFVRALQDVGYRVASRARSCDQIAPAPDGWRAYAKELKGFAAYAKRFTGRLTALWDVACDEYGASAERPVAAGFAVYESLQQRSWKGGFSPAIRRQRIDLLNRAEARGWARVFVLRVADVPVAAHVWFRLGGVATWLSTAYDQTLAALSPGTVMMWEAQTRLFADDPPRVIDLLPGANPQKDRLTLERPPLYVTDAVRQRIWSGVTLPATQRIRQVRRGVVARLRARGAQAAPSPPSPTPLTSDPVTVDPAASQRQPVRTVEPDQALRRYLATASGQPSPAAMAQAWSAEDQWFVLDGGPRALLRVSISADPPVIRELVQLDRTADPMDLARQFAAAVGRPVVLDLQAVHRPTLPWPDSWRIQPEHDAGAGGQHPARGAEVSADAR